MSIDRDILSGYKRALGQGDARKRQHGLTNPSTPSESDTCRWAQNNKAYQHEAKPDWHKAKGNRREKGKNTSALCGNERSWQKTTSKEMATNTKPRRKGRARRTERARKRRRAQAGLIVPTNSHTEQQIRYLQSGVHRKRVGAGSKRSNQSPIRATTSSSTRPAESGTHPAVRPPRADQTLLWLWKSFQVKGVVDNTKRRMAPKVWTANKAADSANV